ncbi:MAG: SDR family oxidoreductase [Calditrichaeota bacterium]|nr:MAG: SDR family oxidoreductase [Calditrichota bacterium]
MARQAIFVTGAASGIGRATAQLFARKGWFVGLYDVNEAALATLAKELGSENCCAEKLDVTNYALVEAAMSQFAERSEGRLDVLFNCAGLMQVGAFETLEIQGHRRLVDVNIVGVLNCTYAAFPWLKATPNSHVITMSSASAVYGVPELATYSASKFFVRGITEALNIEWRRYGITVCDLMPPYVNTPMVQQARRAKSMDRLGVKLVPEQIAATVWRAAHGKKVHWPVSLQFKFLYILSRMLPTGMNRLVMRWISGF